MRVVAIDRAYLDDAAEAAVGLLLPEEYDFGQLYSALAEEIGVYTKTRLKVRLGRVKGGGLRQIADTAGFAKRFDLPVFDTQCENVVVAGDGDLPDFESGWNF